MAKKKPQRWTEAMVFEMLQKHFPSPANVLLPQVRNGTGYERRTRTADAVGASVYPSRGLFLFGIEIKVSYSDFRKELEEPAKAESIQRFCQHWYLAAPKGVIPIGEVPETWGLIECARTAKTVKRAPNLECEAPDMLFVASIMRALEKGMVPIGQVQPRIDDAHEAGVIYGQRNSLTTIRDLNRRIASFEEVSGIKLTEYGCGEIGQAVKLIRESGTLHAVDSMHRLRTIAAGIVKTIDDADKPEEESR